MKSKFVKLNYVLVITILLFGCNTHRITPVEKVLGKGWQCYVSPDEFKIAGIVLEQTRDGKFYVDANYNIKATDGESAIPDNSYKSQIGIGILAKWFTKDLSTNNNLDKSSIVDVKYMDTNKQVIYNAGVREIIKDYETKDINPRSKYFLIRESYTAKSADILISKSLADSLNIGVTDSIKLTGNIGNSNKYTLKKEFSKPLAICNLTYEFKLEKGFNSKNIVTVGNPVIIPSEIVVNSK